MQFYYTPDKPNPAKVALYLEEAELDYQLTIVDFAKGEQQTPGYLAINPNGKTPALVDDGAVIFDSTAILIHLAEVAKAFLPSHGSLGWAQGLSWLMLIGTGVAPMSGQAIHFLRYAPVEQDYALNRYVGEAERHWTIIERQLSRTGYLVGHRYSFVDMALWSWAPAIAMIFGSEGWARYPNVKRLLDEIDARPAAKRVAGLSSRTDILSI